MTSADEIRTLVEGAGWHSLPNLRRLRITGEDRVRWLNGMVTNTVRDLQAGELNYTFLLNAQGRIQGDGWVWMLRDALLFATEQGEKLGAHLDKFIIMDDVELLPEEASAFLVAGPQAAAALDVSMAVGQFIERSGALIGRTGTRQYTVWGGNAPPANAAACGPEAAEALRILEGVPRYGVDITDRTLAQETGQTRALNFNKGCYLGQEIVERVRSRATVHRAVRSFALEGDLPQLPAPLFAQEKADAVGELTSITQVELPGLAGKWALGTVRTEAAEGPLRYNGGTARSLAKPVLAP